MKFIALLVFFSLCFSLTLGANGVDVSTDVNETEFLCIGNNYTFTITRCGRSDGSIDDDCAQSVALSQVSGIMNNDITLTPCYRCGTPSQQVLALIDYVVSNGVDYNVIWVFVNGNNGFGTNLTDNAAFFTAITGNILKFGLKVGVFTTSTYWTQAFGNMYTGGSMYPLWYQSTDNKPNFSDFVSFGGWQTPTIKQYTVTTVCGAPSVGLNYRA